MVGLKHVAQGTVRDRLWMWGNEPKNQNASWGFPGVSRMTAVEAAVYFEVPNVVMVTHNGLPAPPLDKDAIAMRPLKRVVWSIVNSGGGTSDDYREHVFDIAARFPNFTGCLMDDFFRTAEDGSATASLSVADLGAIRERLTLPGRQLELWAVLYTHQFDMPVQEHLAQCDVVHFWTSPSKELVDLQANFAHLEALYPDIGKVQGLYMWDFREKRPVSVDLMKHQCELGLQWLAEGRIQGMAFIASCLCDFELPCVEWTRSWIADTGDQAL